MTEYNLLNKPGRKKLVLFLCLVFLIGYAFFFLNSAKMDDFTSLITDTTVQYQDNGVLKDYDQTALKDNSPLIFNIKATVPQGVLSSYEDVEKDGETTQELTIKNNALTFSLPEGLKLDNTETNKLYLENDLNTSIGTYEVKDNLLTMYFDEDHVKSDADQELKLSLVLETDSNHLVYDGEGLSKIYFNNKEVDIYKYVEQPTETTVTQQVDDNVVQEVAQYSEEPQENNVQEGSIETYSDETQSTNIQKTDNSVDFKDYLTSASVKKNENGHWVAVEGNVFTDGDQVQVNLSYKLPANTVTTDNKVIYYQLPDGIRPIEEQSGNVTQGGKVVGTYHIGTDGEILIEFNSEFADGEAFTGDIQFEGIIAKTGDDDQDKISFGNDTEDITVKKKKDNYDLSLKKTSSLDENDKNKVNYSITASTTNGTGESLNITDSFASNTNATGTYDRNSMKLYRVSADGTKTEVTNTKPTFSTTSDGQNKFEYKDLPKLEKGESYVVEYSATYDLNTTNTDGSSKLQNSVHAKNQYVDRWSNSTTEISKKMISKEGSYDQSTGLIKWQIKINESKQNIGGYNLKDTLPEGIDFKGDITITDSKGNTVKTITPENNSIDYTFTSDSNDTYTVTYYTTAPNKDGTVENTSTIGKDGTTNTSTGTVYVTHRNWAVDKQWKKEEVSKTDGLRRYYWNSTVTMPEGELTSFTYKDTIQDATDADGKTHKDTHYAIASELDKALQDNISIRIDGNTYKYNNNDYIEFEFIYYDENGNVVEATDSTTHVKSFEVKVTPKDGKTIENAQYLYINEYPTIVDTSNVGYGETWKFTNTGEKDGLKADSSHSYTRPKPIIKQGGTKKEWGFSYKDGKLTGNFEEINGKLYYRILINTQAENSNEFTISDKLPEGTKLVDNSLKATFYYNDNTTSNIIRAYGDQYKDEDGYDSTQYVYIYDFSNNKIPTVEVTDDNELKVTIKRGYNFDKNGTGAGNVIQLTYELDVSDDPSWNDPTQSSKVYENTVTWGENKDTQKTEITRDLKEVEKKGAQVYDENGQLTNKITYNVIINPTSKDLDPKSDTLTLKDNLELPNGVTANLDIENTKLYFLDLSNKNDNYHGEEVSSDLYGIAYDDRTNEITATVPDKFACVLQYTYTLDKGNVAGDYQVKNKASLNGEFSTSSENKLKNVSSSATVEKGKLHIYKVDDKNYNKRLAGAEFTLEKFNTDTKSWDDITKNIAYDGETIKTNKDGEILLQGDSQDKKLVGETIYRLKEVKAPDGYDTPKEGEYYYFVLIKSDQGVTLDQTKSNMYNAFNDAKVSSDDVHFFSNNEEVNMFVTNHTSNIGVKKVWVDKDNKLLTNHPNSTTVKLIQHVNKPKGYKVNLKIYDLNNWDNPPLTVDETKVVKKDGKIKITLPFYNNDDGLAYFKENNLKINGTSDYKLSIKDGGWSLIVLEIDNVSADINIEIRNGISSIDLLDYDYDEDYDKVSKKVESQVLNADNNWTYSWNSANLPKQDADGNEYYYTVEEDVPSGYQVSYTNNDGIKEGDITVTNKKLDNYDLPDSGGFGTLGYYAIGALLITATLFAYIANKKNKGVYNK